MTDCTITFKSTLFKSFEAALQASGDIAPVKVMDLGRFL